MKELTLVLAFVFLVGSITISQAQSTRKEKQAAKVAAVKKMIDDGNYVFEANIAYPERGGSRELTSEYDLKVVKDSVIAFLPYFGEAHMAPNPGETEGGIKFTTTSFDYTSKQRKNGNWEIFIKPKDKNILDWRDVQQLRLDVSEDGYANLQVISTSRDPISFSGYLKEKN